MADCSCTKESPSEQVLLDCSLTVTAHLPQQIGDEAESDQRKTATAV
jgi:hypothetical protein